MVSYRFKIDTERDIEISDMLYLRIMTNNERGRLIIRLISLSLSTIIGQLQLEVSWLPLLCFRIVYGHDAT
jgi:hypothetical protein